MVCGGSIQKLPPPGHALTANNRPILSRGVLTDLRMGPYRNLHAKLAIIDGL